MTDEALAAYAVQLENAILIVADALRAGDVGSPSGENGNIFRTVYWQIRDILMSVENYHAWIFVSHASDDLPRVREVRNYLESKGASPLLFYLKALAKPEEFWPLIEREIAARNFFLYCESAAAEKREWVRRERAAVDAASRERPIRIDSIRVDGPELDLAKLDSFLAKTRVFPTYEHQDLETVRPFLMAMERAGFQVFIPERDITGGSVWQEVLQSELSAAARDGWVVVFLSQSSMKSLWVKKEIGEEIKLGAKLIPVAIEKIIRLPAWHTSKSSMRRLIPQLRRIGWPN